MVIYYINLAGGGAEQGGRGHGGGARLHDQYTLWKVVIYGRWSCIYVMADGHILYLYKYTYIHLRIYVAAGGGAEQGEGGHGGGARFHDQGPGPEDGQLVRTGFEPQLFPLNNKPRKIP